MLSSLKPFRVGESDLFDIKLCVEEALRNAMVHGNKSDICLPVTVRYCVSTEFIEVDIEDRGAGFNHRRLADPTKKTNLLKVGGRGVYLIKALMDRVEFSKKGNRIKMVKFIDRGKA